MTFFKGNLHLISFLNNKKGSALIFVLWILVTVIFLSGEYLLHNREKAGIATNVMDSLKRKQAVESILHLFAVDVWPLPEEMGFTDDAEETINKETVKDKLNLDNKATKENNKELFSTDNDGVWFELSPGGIDLSVKVEKESKKVNINSASDDKIREVIQTVVGENEEEEEQVDQLTDAILDWRDSDRLVRLEGAEDGYYKENNLSYLPANGKFKTLMELLLVKGVSNDFFFGDSSINSNDDNTLDDFEDNFENDDDNQIDNNSFSSLIDAFTIYPKGTKRVTIKIPGRTDGYHVDIVFMKKEKNRWVIIDRIMNIE